MKEKTTRQIENMKTLYTFGAEIECNNITRKKAAQVAAEFFGTGRIEEPTPGDHYDTWKAYDAEDRMWQFTYDSSIAGISKQKCEVVTPLLHWDDIPFLQELCRQLRHAGAVSRPDQGCGIHLHVSRTDRDFTPQELINAAHIMASHEAILAKALKIDENRMYSYCKMVDPEFLKRLKSRKPKTMEALRNCWYDTSGTTGCGRYDQSRYRMYNLHSLFQGKGIEMRLFQFQNAHDGKLGGIHAGELLTFIQLSIGIMELASQVTHASAKPVQQENPRYALRCWLLRLGFIGDEFKTARLILTRNLEGSASFRNVA